MRYFFIFTLLVTTLYADGVCDINIIDSEKTKKSMQRWLDGNFGLKPHKVNYILPYGYREDVYSSDVPTIDYSNIEAELQVSLKLQVAHNLFKLDEKYFVAYTQQAFWQLYISSAPFRESLYNPELFVEFPIEDRSSFLHLRSVSFGYAHKSNGQPDTSKITFDSNQTLENKSRSINYLSTTIRMQHQTLITDISTWVSISDLSDNPDMMDYYGYTSLKMSYFLNQHMFTFFVRGNIATGNSAIEGTYSYPLLNDANLYIKLFSGYGESLIDYNKYITKFSIGFSFSR